MKIIIHEHQSSSSSEDSSSLDQMMEMMTEMQETIQSLKRKIHKQNKKIKTMVSNENAKPVNTHIRYEYLDDSVQSNIIETDWGEPIDEIADFDTTSHSAEYCSKSDDGNSVEEVEVEVVVEKVVEPAVKKEKAAKKEKPAKKEKAATKKEKAVIAPIQVKIEEVAVVKPVEESVVKPVEESVVKPVEESVVKPVVKPVESIQAAESKVEEAVVKPVEEELEQIEIDGKDYYVDDDNVIYEVSDPSIRVGILDENDEPIFDKDKDKEEPVKVAEVAEVAETEELVEEEELDEIEIDGQDYYVDGDNVIYGMNEQRDPGDRVGVLDENDDPIFDAVP